MGTFDHPSGLVHRIAYPSPEKPGSGSDSRLASFPNEGRKRPALSRPEDDLIFHSLIASGDKLEPQNPWVTFGALIVQVLFLVAAVVIPVSHIDPLPKRERPTTLYLEAPVKAGAIAAKINAPKPTFTHTPAKPVLAAPVHTTQEAPRTPVDTTSEVATGMVGGSQDGALLETFAGPRTVPVPAKAPEPAPVKRIRVASGVAEANLIHDVPPQYPPEAGRERIEGTVVLLAVIGTDGSVKDLRVESGPPVFTQAAIEAVKQWRYKPYLLNGVPVEIDSRITVNFTMSRG
jgi:protein TonB